MSGALIVAVIMIPGPLGQSLSSFEVSVHGDWHIRPIFASADTKAGRYNLAAGDTVVGGITEPGDSSILPRRDADGESCGSIRVTGVGNPPRNVSGAQARLMARRAAEVIAVRNLATTLGCSRRAVISGFRYASTTYRADGSVEVVVEHIPGRGKCSCSHREVGSRRVSTQHTARTSTRIQTRIR